MLGTAPVRPDLARRIAAEEEAVARAQLVIASSRDEAEVQYAGYAAYDPGRVRVLPPGSDLARFAAAQTHPRVDAAIDRFLDDPDRPAILALARPVARKNLAALVRAYGESRALQAHANLVIIAGTRDDIDTLDGDMAATMRDLLVLIDRYDLYGRVAYPKTHRPEDVPAIYAHARTRGGLFVNPALNEPFGLTLLEASAAGLPLVATDSGGPPTTSSRPAATGSWSIHAPTGRSRKRACGSWAIRSSTHAAWLAAPGRLQPTTGTGTPPAITSCCARCCPRSRPPRHPGSCSSATSITRWSAAMRHGNLPPGRSRQAGLAFGVATGRSFHSAMAVLEQQDSPGPR